MNAQRLATWGVVGGIVGNFGLMATFFCLQQEAELYVNGERFPDIAGIDFSGAERRLRNSSCYVIRVTSDKCPFCEADQPAYDSLIQLAQKSACEVVEVAPREGDMGEAPRESVTQLRFVDMALGHALSPTLTPQTIVLDGERKVIWKRLGTFDDKSWAEAAAILKTLSLQTGAVQQ